MKRINREFCLTDESVNCYGYRLLTSGLQLDAYKPPVGFLMHDRDRGVAVSWSDFRFEGDALYAIPTINDSLFPDLAQQVEEGFINAASVGHIVALEVSDDPALQLPGQTGPTVTRWYPREISLVDIPGNPNALGRLYDEADNVLHDLTAKTLTQSPNPKPPMDFKAIFPNLKADTDEELSAFLLELQARALRADELEQELNALRADQQKATIDAIIDRALADHRITPAIAPILAEDYRDRPDALQNLINQFPARKAVPNPDAKKSAIDFNALNWDELDKKGLLPQLRAENPDLYDAKFRARFNH